jgi:putative transposase
MLTQSMEEFEQRYARNEAMARAYMSGQHKMAAIAEHFGVHYSTVSRMVASYEDAEG